MAITADIDTFIVPGKMQRRTGQMAALGTDFACTAQLQLMAADLATGRQSIMGRVDCQQAYLITSQGCLKAFGVTLGVQIMLSAAIPPLQC